MVSLQHFQFAANGLINQAGSAALGYANNDLDYFRRSEG